jgi:hypothetical protein
MKYKSMLGLCLAGVILSIFAPRRMRKYYPTVYCVDKKVKYYLFAKHTWLMKETSNVAKLIQQSEGDVQTSTPEESAQGRITGEASARSKVQKSAQSASHRHGRRQVQEVADQAPIQTDSVQE